MELKKSHFVLLVAIPAVLAGILVFDNFDFNIAPKQDSDFSVSALNPFQTYEVNDICEFFELGFVSGGLFQNFPKSDEEFEKYSKEFVVIEKYLLFLQNFLLDVLFFQNQLLQHQLMHN